MRATAGGLGLERPLPPRHEVALFDGARPVRLAFVVPAHQVLGSEALVPLADRLTAGADPLSDRLVVQAIGAQQPDLSLVGRLGERTSDWSASRVPWLTSSAFNGRPPGRVSLSFGRMERKISCSCHYVKILAGHDTSCSAVYLELTSLRHVKRETSPRLGH